MEWAKSQRVALKCAIKKLFYRRGVKYLTMDGKEFDTPTHFMNYITKHNKIDLVCVPYNKETLDARLAQNSVAETPKQVKPDQPSAPPTAQ